MTEASTPAAAAATTPPKMADVSFHRTGFNEELVEKAVSALLKHHEQATTKSAQESGKLPLLGVDRPLQVQIILERIPSVHKHNPVRVLIPHPLYKVYSENDNSNNVAVGVEEPSVCLIVKEDSKVWVKEMISRFHKYMGCIQKVMGLDSLRRKYARYEQRRELLHKYDLFMADTRILPMVGKALGTEFYRHKKLPIPIMITRKEALPFAVQKSLAATFFTLSQGNCVTVCAGNTGMPVTDLVENVVAVCQNAVPSIPRKWANIRSIGIKTPESMSLPIYNKTPEELIEIARLAGVDGNDSKIDQTVEEQQPEKEARDANEREAKQRKRKLATKSPLVRAVQRQLEDTKEKKDSSPTKKQKTETKKALKLSEDESKSPENEQKNKKETETTKTYQDKATDKQQTKLSKEKRTIHDEPPPKVDGSKKSKPVDKGSNKKGVEHKLTEDSTHTDSRRTTKVNQETESSAKIEEGKVEKTKEKTAKVASLAKRNATIKDKKPRNADGGNLEKATMESDKKGARQQTANDSKPTNSRKSPTSKREAQSNAEIDDGTPKSKKAKPDMKASLGSSERSKENKGEVSSSKTTRKSTTSEADEASPNKGSSQQPKFLPSTKFQGSKPGYVFRKGDSGVGYYIDVKPVVDPMVLEALAKLPKKSSASGGRGNANNRKGKRQSGKQKSRHSR